MLLINACKYGILLMQSCFWMCNLNIKQATACFQIDCVYAWLEYLFQGIQVLLCFII